MIFGIFLLYAIPIILVIGAIVMAMDVLYEKKNVIIFLILIIFLAIGIYFGVIFLSPTLNNGLQFITYFIPIVLSIGIFYYKEENLRDDKEEKIAILAILCIIFFFITPMGISMLWNSATRQFSYMEENVEVFTSSISSPIHPFTNEPSDEDVRLITKDFALKIAKQFESSLGSNVEVSSANVIKYEGSLYWCLLYRNKQTLTNIRIEGYVLVDVNNPNSQPIIQKTENWVYAEGLFFINDIGANMYLKDYSAVIKYETRSYPAYDEDLEKWVYVSLLTKDQYHGNVYPSGIYITDVTNGNFIESFDIEDVQSGNLPDYIIQVIDEWVLEKLVSNWGNHKDKRMENNYDYFSDWRFVKGKSEDRFSISQEIRYIIDPDNPSKVIGVMPTNVRGNDGSLHGYFVINQTAGMKYYEMRDLGLISPSVAGTSIKSLLSQANSGTYVDGMPILYTLITEAGSKLVYYVPIYWTDNETYRLSHFGIVDAKDTSKSVLKDANEYATAKDVVKNARLAYKEIFGSVVDPDELEPSYYYGTVNSITFTNIGEDIYILHLNNNTVWCAFSYISNGTMWLEIMDLEPTDVIKYEFIEDLTTNINWTKSVVLI